MAMVSFIKENTEESHKREARELEFVSRPMKPRSLSFLNSHQYDFCLVYFKVIPCCAWGFSSGTTPGCARGHSAGLGINQG